MSICSSTSEENDPSSQILLHLPSVAVSCILAQLEWRDKMNAVAALPTWQPHLCTTQAWPVLYYTGSFSPTDPLTNQDVQAVCDCLSLYGRYLSHVKLQFYNDINLCINYIFETIADCCSLLRTLSVDFLLDRRWTHMVTTGFIEILNRCNRLTDVALCRPTLDWYELEHTLSLSIEYGHAHKITQLELKTVMHEGPLDILKKFTNLKRLKIARQELSTELLVHLARNGLEDLSIFQEEEIPFGEPMLYDNEVWTDLLNLKPYMRCNLLLRDIIVLRSSFPEKAPLRVICLVDLVASLTKGIIDTITENYKDTLEGFIYSVMTSTSASVEDKRLPVALVDLTKKCKKLRTLVCGFDISSTTVLLLCHAAMSRLSLFVVAQRHLSYEFDWSIQPEWSANYTRWLQDAGKSGESLEAEVSALVGYPWRILSTYQMWPTLKNTWNFL